MDDPIVKEIVNKLYGEKVEEFNWGEYYKDRQVAALQKTIELPYYLCTPYSKFKGGFENAYQMAAEMLMFLERNKLFVFCPIVHSHTAVKYAPDLHTHEFWLDIDFKFIRISRGLIVCTMEGWKESYGIQQEIKYAETLGLPVYYTSFMELPEFEPRRNA